MPFFFNPLSSTLDYYVVDGGVTTMAAVGAVPNANGASISGVTLTLQPANGTNPGVVTTAAQTIAGAKTFSTAPVLSSLTGHQALTLDASKNIQGVTPGSSGNILTSNGTDWTSAAPATSGTVTSVSVVSANGLAGTVATATSTPAITLTTTVNAAVLAGNGTAIAAATTTGTGSTVVLTGSPAITSPAITGATTITGNADAVQLTVLGNATQTGNIAEFKNSGGTLEVGISKTGQIQANEIYAFGQGDIVLTTGRMYNSSGTYTVDWANSLLRTSGGTTVDWSNKQLHDNTNPQLSWSTSGVNYPQLSASLPLKLDSSKNATAAAINLSGSEVTSTLAVGNGGTGITSTPTNGQLPIGNGTNYTAAALTQGTGITITNGAGSITVAASNSSAGDISPTSFTAANNQSSAANVTGLTFSTSTVRSFEALVSVSVVATSSLFEVLTLRGIFNGTSWDMSSTSNGSASLFTFTITNAGQVQYTSGNYSGFTSATVKFRAITLVQ